MNVHEPAVANPVAATATVPQVHVYSNPRGQGTRVPWLFVLPSTQLDRIYCWGKPSKVVWDALVAMASQVVMLDDLNLTSSPGELRCSFDRADSANDSLGEPPFRDLLYLAAPLPRDAERRQLLKRWIQEVIEQGGAIYCDGDLRDVLPSSRVAEFRQLLRIGSHAQGLYVAPSHEKTLCHQFDATRTRVDWISYLRRIWANWKHFGIRSIWQRPPVPPIGTICCGKEQQQPGPPQFLQTIAKQHGVPLEHYRWGFLANGSYPSRKLLFYLLHPQTQEREFVVKMTQAAPFNDRLQREARALEALAQWSLSSDVVTPRVCFSGEHAGRWVLGESYLEGKPFDQIPSIDMHSSPVQSLLNWLAELGRQTAHGVDAHSDRAWIELEATFHSYLELYQPPRGERQYLFEQMDLLRSHACHLPRVFTHGDLGRWNLMLQPSGRLVVLDWESYERQGMPGWDLFYFLRSQLVGASRRRGRWDRIQALQDAFLAEGPTQAAIVQAIKHYFEQLNLPHACFEPLFVTCWMHRAVKEATRLKREQLASAHYARWLRTIIQQRTALQTLTSLMS